MVKCQLGVRKIIFYKIMHFLDSCGVSGVDIDVLDFISAFLHILQDAQARFAFAKIVVQADIADRVDVAEQESTFFIGSQAVVLEAIFR